MDAHPSVMIGNEYDMFDDLIKGKNINTTLEKLCRASQKQARKMERSSVIGKGYSLKMGNFHGTFDEHLTLIGIRRSTGTLRSFFYYPEEFEASYKM